MNREEIFVRGVVSPRMLAKETSSFRSVLSRRLFLRVLLLFVFVCFCILLKTFDLPIMSSQLHLKQIDHAYKEQVRECHVRILDPFVDLVDERISATNG